MALRELPRRLQAKTQVIYQSAESVSEHAYRAQRRFEFASIAHLRAEKDPLARRMAVRRSPAESRIRVTHIGLALDAGLAKRARAEARRNPRYRWLGQLSHEEPADCWRKAGWCASHQRWKAAPTSCRKHWPSGVPVIATKIAGLIGTLGKDFPGYFPVGDTKKLTRFAAKRESDPKFYRALKRHCAAAIASNPDARSTPGAVRELNELDDLATKASKAVSDCALRTEPAARSSRRHISEVKDVRHQSPPDRSCQISVERHCRPLLCIFRVELGTSDLSFLVRFFVNPLLHPGQQQIGRHREQKSDREIIAVAVFFRAQSADPADQASGQAKRPTREKHTGRWRVLSRKRS